MSTLKNTLSFIRATSIAATISGHGSKAEFISSRIVQAATAETLLLFGERMAKLLGSDSGNVHPLAVAGFVSAVNSPDAAAVLSWLRKMPKLAAMIVFLPQGDFDVAVSEIGDVGSADANDIAVQRPEFEYGIVAELTSCLAHGSDTKAGNATLFRRQMVRGKNGGMMTLPFYSGNAVRGMLRDILADELTKLLGLTADRAKPPYTLWFFHSLYAGGALDDGTAAKAAMKKLGDNGSTRAEGVREFRDKLPSLSVLGCAMGNKILSGRMRVADLRPRCTEWGNGNTKAESLFDWTFLTRRDDHEGREDGDNKSMIANTEVLRAGVVLDGGVDGTGHESELERAAIIHALRIWRGRGYIGAESRRGFGLCNVELKTPECSVNWANWVEQNRVDIIEYLTAIDALVTEK